MPEATAPATVRVCPDDGLYITVDHGDDWVGIYQGDLELVAWGQDEWVEDPSIVPEIVKACIFAATDPDGYMRALNEE